ncbi:DUF5662 family protein [Xiamenia xianingshaonis]|uniref:DUF5662 family protein n=1 Tax=Xiamenia xianingshaonis TaxID=2682776 RepID=UPI0021BDCBDC|nr:DUF5662 family protein [Xiamenia xianingshaonis]
MNATHTAPREDAAISAHENELVNATSVAANDSVFVSDTKTDNRPLQTPPPRPVRVTKPAAATPSAFARNAAAHFATITRHRLIVCELCCKAGLVWQGLTHDLSKYSPTEFATGMRYFQGTFSPNAAQRDAEGYSTAWLHHKGRNRHHFEYWTDIVKGSDGSLVGVPMPTRYVIEMFCDRIAASKVYEKEAYTDASSLIYFSRELELSRIPMHPDTAAFLYVLLDMLAERGEEATFAYIRENIVAPRYVYTPKGRF